MATPRISRSSSSSAAATAARGKQRDSSQKEHRPSKPARHRSSAAATTDRSVAALARKIAAIKRKLIAEAPSQEILDDFFEGVTTDPSFVFASRRGPKWLCDAIARACEEILDKPTGQSLVYLVATPQHDLLHGSVVIDGYTGTAVFFADLRLGAIGLYPENKSRGSCFVRLVMVDASIGCHDEPN